MAKRKRARAVSPASVSTASGELSTKVQKAIEDIKKPFTSFVTSFTMVSVSREELAPKFINAFGLWQSEMKVGATFVNFVRLLEPAIGNTREEYRNHRAYQAAEYLRRLVGQKSAKAQTASERAKAAASAPVSAITAMARAIKALMIMGEPESVGNIWIALKAINWSDRTIKKIQQLAPQVDPLVNLKQPRGVHAVGHMKIEVPAPVSSQQEAAA